MRSKIFCLMSSSNFMNPDNAELLLQLARRMHDKGVRSMRVQLSTMEGEITTTGNTYVIGDAGGMIFNAEVETEAGHAKVRYLVRTTDLEDDDEAVWGYDIPCPVHRRAAAAAYN